MLIDGPDTSPETPSAKRRFTTNQAIRLVSLLQAIVTRVEVLERTSVYIQCRIDRSNSSSLLDERRKEIQDDTINKLEEFMESLDEDERPSQAIIVNVNKSRRPDSRNPRTIIYRTANIIGVLAGIVGGIIYGLYRIGIIK